MYLYEIEFTSIIYNSFTNFNSSYNEFVKTTKSSPDLTDVEHIKALLRWLNRWGCRQFALNYHEQVSSNLKKWYIDNIDYLPSKNKNIWELKESDYNLITTAFNSLTQIVASVKIRDGRSIKTTVGPTGTSKIFFALRPKSLIPLDIPMRNKFRYAGDSTSYIKYLKQVKDIVIDLDKQCRLNGFRVEELPYKIGRDGTTLPALIDEYLWVTISNNAKPPDKDTLKRWIKWKYPKPENDIWSKIIIYLAHNKKLNLLSSKHNPQIFNIVEISEGYLKIQFEESKKTLKIEKQRFISAYRMLGENKGTWTLVGASRVNTKSNTLEGRIKLDFNNNLNGLSTASWVASILEKAFDNIKFNYKYKGQALKME